MQAYLDSAFTAIWLQAYQESAVIVDWYKHILIVQQLLHHADCNNTSYVGWCRHTFTVQYLLTFHNAM